MFKIHQKEVSLVIPKEYLHFMEKVIDLGWHWPNILLDLKSVSVAMKCQGNCDPKNDLGRIIQHGIEYCQLRFKSE